MKLLAEELARRGHSVAIVVYPVSDPEPGITRNLRLVERARRSNAPRLVGAIHEAMTAVSSLMAADGRVTIVRTGNPFVGFLALYSLVRRRRFIFSSASNFDFLERSTMSRFQRELYRFGVRRADAIVVQSHEQLELARRAFPGVRNLVRIASFAEPTSASGGKRTPEAFFWIGRLVDVKRPLLYADLAAAFPDARFVLVPHLGDPLEARERDLLAQLDAAAARIPNLEVWAPMAHSALVVELASAVAVVNTSSFEGMPNTFLEAWSQGVPVLSFSFDPDNLIRENGLGIAADGVWDTFVAGARRLWAERLERSDLSARTRSYIRDVHAPEVVGTQWDELLGELGASASPALEL